MTFLDKLFYFFQNPGLFAGILIATGLLLAYYLRIFYKNRYNGQPSQVPREEPPLHLSPSAARYIWIHDFDSDCLIAGIIDAVVKDCYRIKWRENSFSIYLNQHAIFDKLTGDEKAALSFNPRHFLERLSISQHRNRFTQRAEDRMYSHLQRHYQKYLLRAPMMVLYGLIFSLASIFLSHLIFENSIPFIIYAPYFLFILPLTAAFFYATYYAFSVKNWVAFPMSVAMAIVGIVIMGKIEAGFDHYLWPSLIPIAATNLTFYFLLPRRTPKGNAIKDQIEEFRNFLKARVSNERAFERSEYYLIPYMVALEVPFSNSHYFAPLLSQEKRGNFRMPFSPF